MPNYRTCFITHRGAGFGTSLYYVTAHWVIRCSGNSNGGRTPETFIRRRDIIYISPVNAPNSLAPLVGYTPREGGHDGNPIVAILGDGGMHYDQEPQAWISHDGVTWATACAEIDAAMAYARTTQAPRASRTVPTGQRKRMRDFSSD
mgnify:CR=1